MGRFFLRFRDVYERGDRKVKEREVVDDFKIIVFFRYCRVDIYRNIQRLYIYVYSIYGRYKFIEDKILIGRKIVGRKFYFKKKLFENEC